MGIWCSDEVKVTKSIPVTTAIESGRYVTNNQYMLVTVELLA